jgi:hypothetical protein
MDLESAKAECEDHNECNGFNFRVSDHTVCFKAADTNANGEALPEYHPNGTGYDVWVKNPEQDSAEQEVDPASYCGEHMGWDSDAQLCIIQPEYTTAKAQCDTELAQVKIGKSSCEGTLSLAQTHQSISQQDAGQCRADLQEANTAKTSCESDLVLADTAKNVAEAKLAAAIEEKSRVVAQSLIASGSANNTMCVAMGMCGAEGMARGTYKSITSADAAAIGADCLTQFGYGKSAYTTSRTAYGQQYRNGLNSAIYTLCYN